MIKLIIFFVLGTLVLVLLKKLILLFTNNRTYQYLLYLTGLVLFIISIFVYRDNNMHNSDGLYYPPRYDGENVIPGKVIDD
tara:strand:+ start:355 stop:597 length:243 start_codon:yes stop_codon:yes gene_type:complete